MSKQTEAYYNSVRPHSGIGWISPNTFEKLHIHPVA